MTFLIIERGACTEQTLGEYSSPCAEGHEGERTVTAPQITITLTKHSTQSESVYKSEKSDRRTQVELDERADITKITIKICLLSNQTFQL